VWHRCPPSIASLTPVACHPAAAQATVAAIRAAGNLTSTSLGLRSHFQPFRARFRRSRYRETVPALADVNEVLPAVFCLSIVRPAEPVADASRAFFHVGSSLEPGSAHDSGRSGPWPLPPRAIPVVRASMSAAKLMAHDCCMFLTPPIARSHCRRIFTPGNGLEFLLGFWLEVNRKRANRVVRDG
jgi:hypothetical protein